MVKLGLGLELDHDNILTISITPKITLTLTLNRSATERCSIKQQLWCQCACDEQTVVGLHIHVQMAMTDELFLS